jgi:hypothetical protein
MIIDPWANLSVFVQTSQTEGSVVAYEVCDPCQAVAHSYEIDGVVMSDFVLPSWFGFFNSGGTFDFKGYINEPCTILPGGYALVFQVPNNNAGWQVVNGMSGQLTSLKGEKQATLAKTASLKGINAPPCGRIESRRGKKF